MARCLSFTDSFQEMQGPGPQPKKSIFTCWCVSSPQSQTSQSLTSKDILINSLINDKCLSTALTNRTGSPGGISPLALPDSKVWLFFLLMKLRADLSCTESWNGIGTVCQALLWERRHQKSSWECEAAPSPASAHLEILFLQGKGAFTPTLLIYPKHKPKAHRQELPPTELPCSATHGHGCSWHSQKHLEEQLAQDREQGTHGDPLGTNNNPVR